MREKVSDSDFKAVSHKFKVYQPKKFCSKPKTALWVSAHDYTKLDTLDTTV